MFRFQNTYVLKEGYYISNKMLKGKHIILGITGSIAAYKAAYIIRALVKKGAEVQVVITPAGKEFITPLTLSTLSSHPVISEFFSNRDGTWNSHVDLGLWADAMLVAPATASTIGKMANGIADNMLVTTYLSCKAPVFVAPAMDLDMFAHPSTRQNLDRLRLFGNRIIEPAEGELASHLVGKGRMEEPDKIVAVLEDFFASQTRLEKKKIVITAGPTYEKIDPVHPNIKRIDVESAEEMYQAAITAFPEADAGILCAAVADYRPDEQASEKIKRETKGEMSLRLVPNKDIAASLGAIKREKQILAGFALETNNEMAHAEGKMKRKNLDFIVLNSLKDAGAGFRCDTNKITIIDKEGGTIAYPLKSKQEVAVDIVNKLATLLK